MSKKALWAEALIFLAFIGVFFILNLVLPDRQFSEQENRYLQMKPEFSFKSLFFGDYTSKFETYTTDQFTFRDEWITLKAASELALGKQENNDVHLCENGTLIEGYERPESSALDANKSALNALGENTDAQVYFALIPDKSDLYASLLPKNAPNDSEKEVIDYCYAQSNATNVDMYSALGAHTDEYIYYRTDHHWTSLGAYYAYQQLCGTLSLPPFAPAAHTTLTAENFYGTHYSKARTWNAVPDTITYYDLPNSLTIYNVTAAGQPADGQTTGLYDTDKLNVYDKYAMFLHGNNGLSRIEGDGTGRILVIKDSYANCFAPYLTANYAQIDVVDFRNYNYGLDQLIADNDYDQILVLYSFDSFKSDPYLYRAGVAG